MYGSTFLITFCTCIILFYIATSVIVWYAYREWKGVAEDCAGGSVTYTTKANILLYGVIDKREDDAIKEAEEKAARIAKVKRENGQGEDDEQPLNP